MKLSDIKTGDNIYISEGFPCLLPGTYTVGTDNIGHYVKCEQGTHYLDGHQDANKELICISLIYDTKDT